MADTTKPNTALWQQAIQTAIARPVSKFCSLREREADEQNRAKELRERYIDRAHDVLEAFLASDDGRIAKELLFVTRQKIILAKYAEKPVSITIYIDGTGLQSTTSFGDNPTTLRLHKQHLVDKTDSFVIVKGFGELHMMLDRINEKLNEIAESLTNPPNLSPPKA